MLVLTRKQQEKICIGNGITITVLKMKGKSVRLGIEAPSEVPVIRGELRFEERPLPEDASDAGDVAERKPSSVKTSRIRESNWASDTQVVLKRVSREEAEKLRGPLRTMLERRAVKA